MTDVAELLMAAFVLFMAAVIGAVAIFVLALGARTWSDAVASQHRARAHGLQADETQATVEAAREAVDEARTIAARAPYVPPTDEELRAALLAERLSQNGHTNGKSETEYTTETNELAGEEQPPIFPAGGYYRP